MIYAVVVMRGQGVESTFADALAGNVKPRRVYVAGMTEEKALSAALKDQAIIDLEEPDALELLNFSYSELIGTEGFRPENRSQQGNLFEQLIAYAKNRAAQLQHESDRDSVAPR